MKRDYHAPNAKEVAAGRLWLHYFNRVLYDRGLITERERNRMALKIERWTEPKDKV